MTHEAKTGDRIVAKYRVHKATVYETLWFEEAQEVAAEYFNLGSQVRVDPVARESSRGLGMVYTVTVWDRH